MKGMVFKREVEGKALDHEAQNIIVNNDQNIKKLEVTAPAYWII